MVFRRGRVTSPIYMGIVFSVLLVLLLVCGSVQKSLSRTHVYDFYVNCRDKEWCFIRDSEGSKMLSFNSHEGQMYFKQIKNSRRCWRRNLLRFRNLDSHERVCMIDVEKTLDPAKTRMVSVEVDKGLVYNYREKIIVKSLDCILANNF